MINQSIDGKGMNCNFYAWCNHLNGAKINEIPNFLANLLTKKICAIFLKDPDDAAHQLLIPLKVRGLTSEFMAMKPTMEEYEDQQLTHIELTWDSPFCNPYDPYFAGQEDKMNQGEVNFVIPKSISSVLW